MEYNSSPNAKKKKNDNEQTITTCVKVLGHLWSSQRTDFVLMFIPEEIWKWLNQQSVDGFYKLWSLALCNPVTL